MFSSSSCSAKTTKIHFGMPIVIMLPFSDCRCGCLCVLSHQCLALPANMATSRVYLQTPQNPAALHSCGRNLPLFCSVDCKKNPCIGYSKCVGVYRQLLLCHQHRWSFWRHRRLVGGNKGGGMKRRGALLDSSISNPARLKLPPPTLKLLQMLV